MTEPNPFETWQQMAGGHCLPRCLHVAADFRVADALDDPPQTAAQLAAAVSANPDALGRVLRLLSAHGVFTNTGGWFAHSPASRLLRTDHPQPMRAFVRMFGLRSNWNILSALDHSVRTVSLRRIRCCPAVSGDIWHGTRRRERSSTRR